MRFRNIAVSPLSGSIGAEIRGVDLTQNLSETVFAEIRQIILLAFQALVRKQPQI